jgi:heptosyltransferase-1
MHSSLLIVKLSSMGDVLHTLPAARHLREAFPEAKLGWAVQEPHAELLRGQSWIDEVIVWRRRSPRTYLSFVRRLRKTRWDVAVDFQGIFRSGIVTRLSGARRRIGFCPSNEKAHWFYNAPVPWVERSGHAVEWYLHLAAAVTDSEPPAPLDRPYLAEKAEKVSGTLSTQHYRCLAHPDKVPDTFSRFPLHPSLADYQAADAWLAAQGYDAVRDRVVVLCPDARREANRWPPEKFAELANRLLAGGLRVAVSGGPASRAIGDEIAAQVNGRLGRADGAFRLLASAALLSRAAAVVTGDTGAMHLAVAVGTRVVALLGPTSPRWTGPYASTAIVVTKHLPCSPCKTAGRCPLKYDPPKCMDDISVDEVYDAVLRQIQAAGPDASVRRRSA